MRSTVSTIIPLLPTADDGSSFRLRNRPGEIQRPHIEQYGSNLAVHADLASVTHGTFTPGGDPATLIVIDFRFIGSECHGRRFRKAIIDVRFASGSHPVGSECDPEVSDIAPFDCWTWNPSTQEGEKKITASLSAGTSGPVTTGVTFGWESTTASKKERQMTLYGSKRIEGERAEGSHNTAKWTIIENGNDKQGIPSFLRTAILLKPKDSGRFRALVSIHAEVDRDALYGTRKRIKGVFGRHVVDPVYFDAQECRKPFGLRLAGVDESSLSTCDLSSMAFQPVRSTPPAVAAGFTCGLFKSELTLASLKDVGPW